jgi:hypothetical protein
MDYLVLNGKTYNKVSFTEAKELNEKGDNIFLELSSSTLVVEKPAYYKDIKQFLPFHNLH